MSQAQSWFRRTFGETPSLTLKGPRLLGLENESPDDLHNIFYRNVSVFPSPLGLGGTIRTLCTRSCPPQARAIKLRIALVLVE